MVNNSIVTRTAIGIHKSTTNKSFLDMHYYLKSQGIQNNDFFLALIDTGLAGVDPRDPNLSANMKTRILNECMRNYWYFLREVVRIPEQGGTVGSGKRYTLHRGNLAMNFLYTLNYNMFVEMPRQHGKTVAAVCRYLWCYNFATSNSEIMFLHKDHNGSKNNLKKLKEIRDALPSYLQLSTSINNDGKKLKVPNTIVMIQNPFNNNKITTYPSARTKEAADNLGRGATIPLQYYDEFAFMPYNKVVYLAAAPAFSTASENAKANHAPYGMVLTTTPGDLLTDSGAYAYHIRNEATPWNEKYYDMSFAELEGLRLANTKNPFFLVSYSYKQLGSGIDYFNKMIREMSGEWPAIRREVLLEWAETATDCPFSQEDLDKIKTYNKTPIRTVLFGNFNQYQFNIYEEIDLTYPPIIGVDVSGATFNDSSAITVIDSRTTRVCATLNCNFMPADDLADVLYQLVSKYMPNAIINIERNGGFGISVVQRLCKTSVKKNLYWEVKEKVIEETFNGARLEKRKNKVKVFGTDSTKDVRARLIEILFERVKYHKDKFIAPILLEEMRSMQVKKNGKVEHSDKTHDDQVFSYLMALYVWYEGKNLAENFHIQKTSLKTDENDEIDEANFEEELESSSKVNVNNLLDNVDNDELLDDLTWVTHDLNSFMTSDKFQEKQTEELYTRRNILISNNKDLAQKIEDEDGILVVNKAIGSAANYFDMPDTLFGAVDPNEDAMDDYYENQQDPYSTRPLAGNLADMYDYI